MSINVEACSTDGGATALDVLPSPATNSNQQTSTNQSAGKKWYQRLFKVDVIVVTATIAIVIGLFQLPIIYFYIPVVSEWYNYRNGH